MRFQRQTLMLHPANRKSLEEAFPSENPMGHAFGLDRLCGLPVEFSEFIPERSTHQEWDAPDGDRFTEYGLEDEKWMKPLGLGTVRTVDDGPAFFLIDDPSMATWSGPLFGPRHVGVKYSA